MQDVVDWVKKRIKALGLNKSEVAARAKLSPPTVIKILRGGKVKNPTVAALAQGLNVDGEDLLDLFSGRIDDKEMDRRIAAGQKLVMDAPTRRALLLPILDKAAELREMIARAMHGDDSGEPTAELPPPAAPPPPQRAPSATAQKRK